MGSLSSHEDCEVEPTHSVDADTPAYRDLSCLDPRSPTLEIVRTPLEVPPTHRSRLRRLILLLDPRSPSLHLNRTPLQRPSGAKPKPGANQKPQVTDLDETANVSVHAEDESHIDEPSTPLKDSTLHEDKKPQTDLRLARALFFGDLSLSESPAPSCKASGRAVEVVGSDGVLDRQGQVRTGDEEDGQEQVGTGDEEDGQEQVGTGDEEDGQEQIGTGDEEDGQEQIGTGGEEDGQEQIRTGDKEDGQEQAGTRDEEDGQKQAKTGAVADKGAKIERVPEPAEMVCAEDGVATPTKPAFAGVKRAELSALPARHNKENVVRKQLLHTPDKARVRTPLSNVASFHNSPLRR